MAEPEPNAPAPLPKLRLRDQDRFTGKNCPPEKRKAIVELVQAGTPTTAIAALTHSSPATVQVVRDQALPEWRNEQSTNLKQYVRNLTHNLVQMTPEQLSKVSLYEKTVSLGIVLDKISLLDGEPTQIVEHRHSVDLSGLQTSLSAPPEIDVTPISGTSTAPLPELTQLPEPPVG